MALLEQLQALGWQYLILLFLGLLIGRLLINKYGRGLNSIPGPPLAGFTDLWRVFDTSFSDTTSNLISLHRKHHSQFLRIGPRVVSVADPNLIPTIYGINTAFRRPISTLSLTFGTTASLRTVFSKAEMRTTTHRSESRSSVPTAWP